jgi:nesprin-1
MNEFFILYLYILLLKNALLQETGEEWEQCEKKMKDVRSCMDKFHQALESPQNKKRPLRDQLGLREKMVTEIAMQKSKLAISVEKLQVHCKYFIEHSCMV